MRKDSWRNHEEAASHDYLKTQSLFGSILVTGFPHLLCQIVNLSTSRINLSTPPASTPKTPRCHRSLRRFSLASGRHVSGRACWCIAQDYAPTSRYPRLQKPASVIWKGWWCVMIHGQNGIFVPGVFFVLGVCKENMEGGGKWENMPNYPVLTIIYDSKNHGSIFISLALRHKTRSKDPPQVRKKMVAHQIKVSKPGKKTLWELCICQLWPLKTAFFDFHKKS